MVKTQNKETSCFIEKNYMRSGFSLDYLIQNPCTRGALINEFFFLMRLFGLGFK